MPRINAATLAEHRAARQRALLDAAKSILAEGVGRTLTLSEVAARVGLARSSVYQYFTSRQDLLDALVKDIFPRWSRRITEAMAAADSPGQQVLAYVGVNLSLVAEGEHVVASALAAAAPGEEFDRSSRAMHEQLRGPLVKALDEAGAVDPQATAELVNAVVYTASRLIESGAEEAWIRARVTELLAPFLLASAQSDSQDCQDGVS